MIVAAALMTITTSTEAALAQAEHYVGAEPSVDMWRAAWQVTQHATY